MDTAGRFWIRDMTEADIAGKGYVHYQSWRETYTGLMDERILASHSLERCQETARRRPENTLVVLDRENGDRVAGFACFLPEAREFASVPDASEIVAFYLLAEYQGLGLGRRLMEACLERLSRPRTVLFVLKGNEKAIGFYEHMGFRLIGREYVSKTRAGELTELEMVLER